MLDNFDPVGTVFSEFTGLAMKHGAVNLGQGFPTIGVPEFVREAAVKVVEQDTLLHQYARSEGNPTLVKVLSRFYEPMLGRQVDPMTEIITTVGATEAIFSTILAFVSQGDKVILMSPHYDSYPASVIMAGGEPVFVRMRPKLGLPNGMPKTSDDWEVDWEELDRVFEEDRKEAESTGRRRIKMMLLNNPHNPLGGLFLHNLDFRTVFLMTAGWIQQARFGHLRNSNESRTSLSRTTFFFFPTTFTRHWCIQTRRHR